VFTGGDICVVTTSHDFGVSRFWKLASQLENEITNKQTNKQGDDTVKQVETRKYSAWISYQ